MVRFYVKQLILFTFPSEHKPEDGLIRVVYSFENCKTFFDPKIYINPQDFRYDNQVYCKDTSGDYQHKVNFTISGNVDSRSCDNNVLYSSNCACNNDGITVKGSCSHFLVLLVKKKLLYLNYAAQVKG